MPYFNPRSSCEERPLAPARAYRHLSNFNPRSSCEERRILEVRQINRIISIHAPHARSDSIKAHARALLDISIHAPHARSDSSGTASADDPADFNPRSSCEERPPSRHPAGCTPYFNPRSSCEERRRTLHTAILSIHISIHAPHARSDFRLSYYQGKDKISIHAPHARSDRLGYPAELQGRISIHAPHARSDCRCQPVYRCARYFNPRSSCEERPSSLCAARTTLNFNPRSSCEERLCHFQALICLTSSYIFREPLTSFRKHFF